MGERILMNLHLFLFGTIPGKPLRTAPGKSPRGNMILSFPLQGEWGIMPPHTNH